MDRLEIFEKEISKMFLAYNRPIQPKTLEAKAHLMGETLFNLDTDKIAKFFLYVRENYETLPTDGQLKKLLRTKADQFATRLKVKQLPQVSDEHLPSPEWRANFFAGVKLILMGKETPESVKKSLGI